MCRIIPAHNHRQHEPRQIEQIPPYDQLYTPDDSGFHLPDPQEKDPHDQHEHRCGRTGSPKDNSFAQTRPSPFINGINNHGMLQDHKKDSQSPCQI